jgi:transposase
VIELTPEDLSSFLDRVKTALPEQDYEIVEAMAKALESLSRVVDEKTISIKRLLKQIFGSKSEKRKEVLNNPEPENRAKPEKKIKGHGRNGASAYTGAEKIQVPHETLKHGDPCPLCPGKVYRKNPEPVIRIVGFPCLKGTIYALEKLRCNLCGETFTASPPEDMGKQKYDETAVAMIPILKYGNGFPFYRLAQLQANMGVPVPAATQWDLVTRLAPFAKPPYIEMIRQAAQGDLFHSDDTNAKILSMIKQGASQDGRKGVFTTGILSKMADQMAVLYFTGNKHAGENINELLQNRLQGLRPPKLMCDALSRNIPKDFEIVLLNCLTHGRRNFVDVVTAFPDECKHVIETLGEVYQNDAVAREKDMSPQERLIYHQTESKPLLDDLYDWFNKQFDEKIVEPNSGLGKAINYMLRHWKALTRFMKVPGAPLDNNICERALKRAIIHRKNSLFYKTQNGAETGDMFMSLIQTCNMAKENAFEYLVALQKNASAVAANPGRWLPWNFRKSMLAPNDA